MLTYFLIFVSIVYSIYYYLNRKLNYWKERNVPGPKPLPIFGNLKESTLRRTTIGEILRDIYKQYENEKVVGVYTMTTPRLFIRDPDIIRDIMIKDFDVFIERGIDFDKEGLGNNLFHGDADTWQVLRTKFTPLFTTGKLKNMMYLMTERGEKFMEHINAIVRENPEQEVQLLIQKYTMTSIASCAFGLNVEIDDDFMQNLLKINKLIFTLSYFFELDMMFPGLLKSLSASFFPAQVKKFFYSLVHNVVNQRNGAPTNRKDFMDLLLELKNKKEVTGVSRSKEELNVEITEGLMAAQAFVFYAAGFETSATTMSFMFYELAKNPDVQDKLIAEIDEVLEKSKGDITYDTIMEMKYMQNVFDETLRMYSLVEPLQRIASKRYPIAGTNVVIEKGQTVLISPACLHHDEKYFPDPEKFDPDRFKPENSSNRHSCAYLPFGVGPRNCIGMRFAKVQSLICITMLLSRFRVEPSSRTQKKIQLDPYTGITSPKGGIHLNIIPRNKI